MISSGGDLFLMSIRFYLVDFQRFEGLIVLLVLNQLQDWSDIFQKYQFKDCNGVIRR